jgi:HK97 family phage prohead protease
MKETRAIKSKIELRTDEANKLGTVRGYASVFGVRSENLGMPDYPIFEVIAKGAFDAVLGDDVRALFNHDPNAILARSKDGKGTLKLGVDEVGLWYEFDLPDTTLGRDLKQSLERGDIDQSSFAFEVSGQAWESVTDGDKKITVRTIKSVKRLYDVSPVTYPAYPDASVGLRSMADEALKPAGEEQFTPSRNLWAARFGVFEKAL